MRKLRELEYGTPFWYNGKHYIKVKVRIGQKDLENFTYVMSELHTITLMHDDCEIITCYDAVLTS